MRKNYDAILLLGLQLDENDQPTEELCIRVREAAKQYALGAAPLLIACGGTTPGHSVSETDVMFDLLIKEGVPQAAIVKENESQDTIGNMRFAAKKLGGAKGKRALVVTSDYHVRRAVMTARRAGFRAYGCAARLVLDEAWKVLKGKELAYTVDMLMGWQDEGKRRPEWTYALFRAVFGRK